MQRLFLASLFKDVAKKFVEFADEDLAGKTVTLIPTAAMPDKMLKFHLKYTKRMLSKMGLEVDELELSTASDSEIAGKLETNDYIYISGGNTFYLLQELNRSGAGDIIKAQVRSGKLLIGESAGAIAAAPNIAYSKDMDDPSAAPQLKSYDALNLIDFIRFRIIRTFP
ncbi:Type 1 glutamine amidotransferase-like domain-containing protein [Candidatus Soleaferrea massiliensis]|uniref:Type 1 glutamine amidotransferase-like domain-containing protein n=1 Tax=Candidatus Soleaferrea massiliensis TaxID=1470354 RepID=UPI000AB1585C|nr:Type 1 glutamine amidotransferase-like domain-containing protein [Candidatus Soleaferrea massiliensis]